ncbi:E3 ubiquitin ligase Rnf157 [Amphibalanus amphitrite]|uniref:E3 ubiquitin ligase Rnf157 n=1 Tax=Amphibalanus amphitrite TaxID=1232801 RepID=A0A6A4X2M5_AMPAM|nr:E3 ubiquitin ligase Rnf157 [Amphibalanus amphitrite]
MLKPLKQKQYIDGLVFLLQEIYGIENKLVDNKSVDEDTEDSGAECVICMSDLRDTLILPCRHLCVCNCCADHLRYQANNCPICRALTIFWCLPVFPQGSDGIPAGYEPVTLVEALNGPISTGRDAAGSPPLPRPTSGPLRSREKGKREDGAGDDTEESTLDSSTDSETSAAVRNSRLVTVIPIEHETHLQLEDYQDTEDEIIEDQCRPGHLAPPNTADTGDSDPSKRLGSYQPSSVVGPRPAEVQLLASESPASRSSRGSLSSGGSTRLLIPGASRETDM